MKREEQSALFFLLILRPPLISAVKEREIMAKECFNRSEEARMKKKNNGRLKEKDVFFGSIPLTLF